MSIISTFTFVLFTCFTCFDLVAMPGTKGFAFWQTPSSSIPGPPPTLSCVTNLTTSAQTDFTIPADASWIQVKSWGAGGAAGSSGRGYGGPGGYTEGIFYLPVSPLSAGSTIKVVVGNSNSSCTGEGFCGGYITYSSGGGGRGSYSGGGLSGVFTGSTTVTATDQARAVVIAGGGGGRNDIGSNNNQESYGRPGNNPTSGGETTMKGNDPAAYSNCSGGGGYQGGIESSPGTRSGSACDGHGGSGFVNAQAYSQSIDYSATTGPSQVVPNTGDSDYAGSAGLHGNLGLVVIRTNGTCI